MSFQVYLFPHTGLETQKAPPSCPLPVQGTRSGQADPSQGDLPQPPGLFQHSGQCRGQAQLLGIPQDGQVKEERDISAADLGPRRPPEGCWGDLVLDQGHVLHTMGGSFGSVATE